MENEIRSLIKAVKEKTGIDVSVFSDALKFFVSTNPETTLTMPSKNDFDEVFSDLKNDITYFRFRYKNAPMTGFIRGISEVEKNYAFFILSFIENSSRDSNLTKGEFLKNILTSDCSRSQVERFVHKFSVPDYPCFVLAINCPAKKMQDVITILNNYNSNGYDSAAQIDDNICAFLKFNDGGVDTQPNGDFAQILSQSVFEETGIEIKIGIGGNCDGIFDANLSFNQAYEALSMSIANASKSNIHTYKEYVWIKMINEIPKYKLLEYLDVLLDKEGREILEDDDILSTVDEFLDCSLNVSETARKLFMHRNTLMYRLDKIERITGLNIKRFPEAVTFQLITILNKILNGNK